VTSATAVLVEGYFQLLELGGFEIRGADQPVRVFELTGMGTARTRVEAVRERGLSRFVGREQELAVLDAALARSHQGAGQIVGVVADAGLGKTRLCYEFLERCRERGLQIIQGNGVAHGKRIPLLPVLEMMRGYFGIEEGESHRAPPAARSPVDCCCSTTASRTSCRCCSTFWACQTRTAHRRPNPEARQRQLLAAVRRLVEVGGQRNRTLILVEDLHGLDPAARHSSPT
jgi:hypothetical protein